MVINDLYRMEDKQVGTLFSFDEEVLKKALKNIYSKDFHPMTDIEEIGRASCRERVSFMV